MRRSENIVACAVPPFWVPRYTIWQWVSARCRMAYSTFAKAMMRLVRLGWIERQRRSYSEYRWNQQRERDMAHGT